MRNFPAPPARQRRQSDSGLDECQLVCVELFFVRVDERVGRAIWDGFFAMRVRSSFTGMLEAVGNMDLLLIALQKIGKLSVQSPHMCEKPILQRLQRQQFPTLIKVSSQKNKLSEQALVLSFV